MKTQLGDLNTTYENRKKIMGGMSVTICMSSIHLSSWECKEMLKCPSSV